MTPEAPDLMRIHAGLLLAVKLHPVLVVSAIDALEPLALGVGKRDNDFSGGEWLGLADRNHDDSRLYSDLQRRPADRAADREAGDGIRVAREGVEEENDWATDEHT